MSPDQTDQTDQSTGLTASGAAETVLQRQLSRPRGVGWPGRREDSDKSPANAAARTSAASRVIWRYSQHGEFELLRSPGSRMSSTKSPRDEFESRESTESIGLIEALRELEQPPWVKTRGRRRSEDHDLGLGTDRCGTPTLPQMLTTYQPSHGPYMGDVLSFEGEEGRTGSPVPPPLPPRGDAGTRRNSRHIIKQYELFEEDGDGESRGGESGGSLKGACQFSTTKVSSKN